MNKFKIKDEINTIDEYFVEDARSVHKVTDFVDRHYLIYLKIAFLINIKLLMQPCFYRNFITD